MNALRTDRPTDSPLEQFYYLFLINYRIFVISGGDGRERERERGGRRKLEKRVRMKNKGKHNCLLHFHKEEKNKSMKYRLMKKNKV